MERAGVKLDTTRSPRSRSGSRQQIDGIEREIYDARRRASSRSARRSSSARSCSRSSGCPKRRRGKTGFSTDARVLAVDPRRARDHREGRALARALEARRAPTSTRCRELIDPDSRRLHTTFNQTTAATGRLSRDRPEPPERPGPHRARPRDPRAASSPTRATCSSRPTTRRSSCACSRTSRARTRSRRSSAAARTSTPPPAREIFGVEPDAGRRRDALEGEDGQLRDRLRAVGVRARRPAPDPARGGRRVHRALPRPASRRSRSSSTRRSRRRTRTATSRRCSAASAGSPSCARASARRASSASASR